MTRSGKPEKSDDLLNDWNIYHFHLTKRFREDGFAKRSDYQIFAWVTADCIYMIQIYPHKEAHLYTKKELLKIIEENWPELLKPHHIKGAVRREVFNWMTSNMGYFGMLMLPLL